MKLKKMEIVGFKSFLDKAVIEFPSGVCAVVGPNGCGKSNIIDALCWVMGEQSIKQLRGKSMGDVIFAGASGKPALNMAEVSLTLENDGSLVPEELRDFSEIMITRRLYRSGDSAYLINKRPCRLKDVHNIFLGSGLGAKSYAIIQQGRIGAITDAGPSERRFFIEEAAGVTRYKQRKEEALRKLDATEQNLLRLNDIIVEVERQMSGLKRQAGKAEAFNQCRHQMTELDVHLSLRQCDALSREIGEADARLTALRDTEGGQRAQLRQLDSALEAIKLSRLQKNQFISEQRASRFETQRRIDKAENDLAHLRDDALRLSRELDGLGEARADLLAKTDSMGREIKQISAEIEQARASLAQTQAAVNREHDASRALRERRTALEGTLTQDRRRLLELSAQEAQHQNIFQQAVQNRETLTRRLRQADEQEALARQKVAETEAERQAAREELDGCRAELEDLKGRISEAEIAVQEERRALEEKAAHGQALQVERKSAVTSYAALKKMEDSLEWYKDGVKAILKSCQSRQTQADPASRPDFTDGVLGIMADVVEPAPSYEMAVEAVFGESLQYILVHDAEVGRKAIDFLQRSGSGRGGFIPVSTVKMLSCDGGPDADKRLLNHVTVSAGYETVAEALLGHVAVAETLPEAMALYHRNGAVQTVVTKGGDLVSHQGIMIGGSRENLAGILLKKKELKTLQQQILELDRALDEARIEQEAAEGRLAAMQAELGQLNEDKQQAARDELESEKSVYRATEGHKSARHRLDIVQLEQEQLQGEQSDMDDDIERFERKLAQSRDETRALQERIGGQEKDLSDLNERAAAFDQRILDFKMEQTALSARLENGENTLGRLTDFQRDAKKRLDQLTGDIDSKTSRHATAQKKRSDIETHLPGLYESLRGLDQDLAHHEGEYQSLTEEISRKDATVAEIQSRRDKSLKEIRGLEEAQSKRRMRLESQTARLEERYQQSFQSLTARFSDAAVDERSIQQMEAQLAELRRRLESMGEVNPGAIREYEVQKQRHEFLVSQRDDLNQAMEDLKKVIRRINRVTQARFLETLGAVNEKLGEVFPRLFEGGAAQLVLTVPNEPLESGLEFVIQPPGKKVTRLSLLSGGEKALCAISFIFSIFLLKPASYCLMDEIDAPLDESNVFRFNELLRIIGEKSQIIMITHNKRSMEFADVLFGVTMEKKGISKIVSVSLERLEAA